MSDVRPADLERLTSLDAFRGIVMLLLIPNVYGGFGFHEMAHRSPEDPIWAVLASVFTHVSWSGCSIWDLILPAFLFMAGVSMPYSYESRKRRGDGDLEILGHVAVRATALVLLGVLVQLPLRTSIDALWPLLLLAVGLPVPEKLAGMVPANPRTVQLVAGGVWSGALLSISVAALIVNFGRIEGLALHDVLPQLGLGYVFAFMLVGRGRVVQALAALSILALYWLAFRMHHLPPAGFDPAAVGILPGDETFTGQFAYWNKSTNLAAAFDAWFLNLFPRPEPYVFNGHGYQTLNFIPSIATMIFGVMTGEYLRSARPGAQLRNGLFKAAAGGVFGGLLAGWLLCPIVKSIWTPSWTLFSAGWVLFGLALCYQTIDVAGRRAWAFPFIVAGRNSILLYVLALKYRWWILAPWHRGFGATAFTGDWGPILEALACGATLWLVAAVLYRLRIFIRL